VSEGASSDKQLEATPHRKEKAKREGNVARSTELVGLAAFAGATMGTIAVLPGLDSAFRTSIRGAAHGDASPLIAVIPLTMAPLFAACVMALLASVAQSGGLRLVAIKLQPSRLAPMPNVKRMFGRDTLVAVARGTIAFGCGTAAAIPVVRDLFSTVAHGGSVARIAALGTGAASRIIFTVMLVGGVFVGADYALARKKWLRELRMSHDEIKREFKENEGDPTARHRRKAMHRSLIRGSLSRVREAAFVVTNPTHIAIALKYAPPETPVPEIVVRAADEGAERVKELARSLSIPVVENVALARALFALDDVGRPIPNDTFVAAAQIVASLARAGALTS